MTGERRPNTVTGNPHTPQPSAGVRDSMKVAWYRSAEREGSCAASPQLGPSRGCDRNGGTLRIEKTGLRARREAQGWSQECLANHPDVRCSTSTIANIENGRRCSDELAGRLAAILSCEPEQVFEQVTFEARS